MEQIRHRGLVGGRRATASGTHPSRPPPRRPRCRPTPAPGTGGAGTCTRRPGANPHNASTDQAGFFARLFDVSMKTFITPSIIKVLFILGLVVISIFSLILLIAGTQADGGIVFVLLAPLYWFVGVLYLRVILEVIVVLFRIEENTRGKR